MKKIVIIAAMDEEVNAILNKMQTVKENTNSKITFYEGKINQKEFIITKSGVGKVNAARTTQWLIDNFEVECIINIGSAGSLNEELDIGDIVIGKNLVQHDFDITAFGHEKGYITETGKDFKSSSNLIELFENYINTSKPDYNIVLGTIASGDIFVTSNDMKDKIRSKFNADCVEMEGAAIAQVCTLNDIEYIVLRSISDKPNGSNQIEFDKFLNLASNRCAELLIKVLE